MYCIVVLAGGVEKSGLLSQFMRNEYIEYTTIGVDFALRTFVIDDKRIKVQMWNAREF